MLCGAESAVFACVQMSACERAQNCAEMDHNRLTCLIGHGNRILISKINSPLPSRTHSCSLAPACTLPHIRSHAHARAHANAIGSKLLSDALHEMIMTLSGESGKKNVIIEEMARRMESWHISYGSPNGVPIKAGES